MSTLGKLFNKSIRLLSSRYSPSSSFLPPYQFSLARNSNTNTCIPTFRAPPFVYPYSKIERSPKIDPHHYICYFATSGYHFDSAESVYNLFVETLAKVLRGDKEEAKRRIYYVCTKWWSFSFGAQIDWETSEKLRHLVEVDDVEKDFGFRANYNSNILQSIFEFSPINWNQRLHNIFSYQQSTACKNGEDSGHWLFYVREPVGGPDELLNYCVELLADVFGSEEEAKERIYIMWFLEPFGFGAEMDAETSKKLREKPNVLAVLPDCTFDVKNKELGVLCIFLSSRDSTICMDYTAISVYPCHECSEYEETEDE